MDVKEEFAEVGVTGITVIDVKGFGRQKGHADGIYRGSECTVDFLPKVMLVVFTSDEMAPIVVDGQRQGGEHG